jgi:hypothetical protein
LLVRSSAFTRSSGGAITAPEPRLRFELPSRNSSRTFGAGSKNPSRPRRAPHFATKYHTFQTREEHKKHNSLIYIDLYPNMASPPNATPPSRNHRFKPFIDIDLHRFQPPNRMLRCGSPPRPSCGVLSKHWGHSGKISVSQLAGRPPGQLDEAGQRDHGRTDAGISAVERQRRQAIRIGTMGRPHRPPARPGVHPSRPGMPAEAGERGNSVMTLLLFPDHAMQPLYAAC